jgi:hypothetical protein
MVEGSSAACSAEFESGEFATLDMTSAHGRRSVQHDRRGVSKQDVKLFQHN